ncbi:MAG: response regulator [Lachnospiraceae bacterium]|nr:response regulator [Lachnospiraceae bacterium]
MDDMKQVQNGPGEAAKTDRKLLIRLKELIVPPGSEIQVAAFNILAVCGILVSIFTAFYNLFAGFGFLSFFECMSGVFISLALMYYTRWTGNYRLAMILTVVIIFLVLFTFLYLTNGGYFGGVPYFFVFATVFTAFLLDGIAVPLFILLELVWYGVLCMYTYYHPVTTFLKDSGEVRVMDVVVCETIVSLSLSLTMYLQIRVYRRKQQELNEAILAAEEANRAKSDFLAKMSHDIRTPLNTIMATNELIVSNTSSARIRDWVGDSNASGRILMSLIDDMLDLTKIEAGRMELHEQPWEPGRLFEEAARAWKVQADKAGLLFLYELDEAVPSCLKGDEDVIRKITNNLLSNAVKYTRAGCIRLAIRWSDELVILVSDTGIGIAPEYLGTIFKPFERGVQEIYRETSGSGLGLAIVKELVDAMGGSITCESKLNEGTTFTVHLPQRIAAGSTDGSHGQTDAEESGHVHHGQFIAPEAQILVVDDNAFNRKVISAFLEPTLIRIDDVESGYEALEMIDIKEYDLVLMDLRMPGMDGAETLERIRSDYPDFHAPVVVLTADIMNGVEERLLGQGFSGFLSKPVSSSVLLDTIAGFLPDKVVPLGDPAEGSLTRAKLESYQETLMPYGIDLRLALEYNAGSAEEFLMRAELFEQYAGETIERLDRAETPEEYYLQVHSVKSIARGVGAHLLAQLSETIEYRQDDTFAGKAKEVYLDEYARVRRGLERFLKEVRGSV